MNRGNLLGGMKKMLGREVSLLYSSFCANLCRTEKAGRFAIRSVRALQKKMVTLWTVLTLKIVRFWNGIMEGWSVTALSAPQHRVFPGTACRAPTDFSPKNNQVIYEQGEYTEHSAGYT